MRSGGVPSLIRIFASLRCALRGANPYATDRFRAAADPTAKLGRNNGPILRWDQRSFWWFMLDRQEESGQGVSFGTMESNFRGKLHECNQNHRFGLHSVNWAQKLDCIRLIERTNWIAACSRSRSRRNRSRRSHSRSRRPSDRPQPQPQQPQPQP